LGEEGIEGLRHGAINGQVGSNQAVVAGAEEGGQDSLGDKEGQVDAGADLRAGAEMEAKAFAGVVNAALTLKPQLRVEAIGIDDRCGS